MTEDHVVIVSSIDAIGSKLAFDKVFSGKSGDDIVTWTCEDLIGTVVSKDFVVMVGQLSRARCSGRDVTEDQVSVD